MRYDSTYSALQALNKALGGEDKQPDSEYSAVLNLMSTIAGNEVGADNAVEAVEAVVIAAENNELPIQQGGSGCNHIVGGVMLDSNRTYYPSEFGFDYFESVDVNVESTGGCNLLGTLTCTTNDHWYHASNFGGDGFQSVYVSIPIESGDFKVPQVDVRRFPDLENESDSPYIILSVSDGITPYAFDFECYDERQCIPFWDYSIENVGGNNWKVTSHNWVNPCGEFTRSIILRTIKWYYNGVECMKGISNQIMIRVNFAQNCDTPEWDSTNEWVSSIPDGEVNAWGGYSYVSDWGYPDKAIPVTINEFINADGYDQNQWFEITANVQGCPQMEVGRIVIDDNTADVYYGDRKGLFINGVSYEKVDNADGKWNRDFNYHSDGTQITIKTLRHTFDVDGETKVCGGKAYGSPVAILTADNRGPASEWGDFDQGYEW